ncbi:hypothetical protein F503_04126 [Ophiostoma piceae UAMH 11346]|uniref:NmrA-like domain-containing protein n=1 Tax=Ophiostoma piceae (strain UAMH 11346) TaxID=1262450 RepID=S3C4V5_OPHP1|nr:hypothetical protein F503_04126 [Ophiostoma piceae UAMH 11346]
MAQPGPRAQHRPPQSLSSTLQLALLAVVGLAVVVAVPLFLTSSTLAWFESTPFFGTHTSHSMSSIKNVAVAGGTGALGTPIVEDLIKSGFNVTLLTREGSTSKAPAGVAAVKAVDYKSVESIKAALAGQHAVVSVLGSLAAGEQTPLVDAAAATSSVIRFIPSEFGVNTRKTPGTAIGGILGAKTGLVDHLTAITKTNKTLKWTGISNGHFFDWGLVYGSLGIDAKSKTVTVYDSGNEKFGASNLPYVARAVTKVLQQAGTADDKTANKYIEIAGFTPTQNEIKAALEKISGTEWATAKAKTADVQKDAEAKLAQGDYSVFGALLSVWQFADGAGHAPDLSSPESGNQLLGLEPESIEPALSAWWSKQ